jgi:hypothetical protein
MHCIFTLFHNTAVYWFISFLLYCHLTLQVLPEQAAAFDAFGSSSAMADEGVLMDGFAPPAGALWAMFPDEQELLQQEWDAYGAVVDTSELRKTDGG